MSLIYYGNPKLRMVSEEVKDINDDIKNLINTMIKIMDESNGIGLAAIQIGRPVRVIVIREILKNDKGEHYLAEPEIYINPKLSNHSKETDMVSEGCLSLPGLHEKIERSVSIHIDALDIKGTSISRDVSGFKARQIMHETDHLNGVLFIDKLPARKRKEIQPELKKIKESYSYN